MTDPAGWSPPGSTPSGHPPPPGWGEHQPPPYASSGGGYSPYLPPPPEVKPGVVPLRPLGFGEILDGSVTYIRRSPKVTLGLSAIVNTVAQGLILALTLVFAGQASRLALDETPDPEDVVLALTSLGVGTFVVVGVSGLALLALTGMLTVVIGRSVLGQQTTMRHAFREVLPRLLRMVGVSVLIGLLTTAVIVVCALPAVLVGVLGPPGVATILSTVGLGLLGAAAAVTAGIWIWVKFSLAIPAVVLEKAGVINALRRSAHLVRGSFWRVLGILLLIGLIVNFISSAVQMPFLLGGEVLIIIFPDPTSWQFVLGYVTLTLGTIIASTIAYPVNAAVPALLYVDQRMRREGLDMALQSSLPQGAMTSAVPWTEATGSATAGETGFAGQPSPWAPPTAAGTTGPATPPGSPTDHRGGHPPPGE